MSASGLPVLLRLAGRPAMLVGSGAAADAKRRQLERAGAIIVDESEEAAIAIVVSDDPEPVATRLKARGLLVNVADRPDLCDFTLPAIIAREPVQLAVSTSGASAGLAAALRQRLEALLPASLGALAEALHAARARLRERWPDPDARRLALASALSPGGALDPLAVQPADAVDTWLANPDTAPTGLVVLHFASPDPEDLTLRQARLLAAASRLYHRPDVPETLLARARADAPRIACAAPPADPGEGLSLDLWMEQPA